MIDLRSDTVTIPSHAMLETVPDAALGDSGRWNEERRGEDPTVNALEELACDILGTEAAAFCTSGTMGNTCALLTHCEPGDIVLVDERQHLYRTEKGAFSPKLGQLCALPYGADERGAPDVKSIERLLTEHDVKLLCVENSNNNRGGQAVPLERMRELYSVAGAHGVPVHLDGARVFNAAHALGVEAKEIVRYADSCMFCVSKGLGAPIGSLVCGSRDFIFALRQTRRMLGGDLRQGGVAAAPAIYALLHNIPRMREDNRRAKRLAAEICGLSTISCDARVDTNIVMLSVPDGRAEELQRCLLARGVSAGAVDETRVRLVFHLGVSEEDTTKVIRILHEVDREMEKRV